MSLLDRLFPQRALKREAARAALAELHRATARYDAATVSKRTSSLRASRGDAEAAAFGQRDRLAGVAQDLVRNNPVAVRARDVLASSVVGDGFVAKVTGGSQAQRKALFAILERQLDTLAIDAAGLCNFPGLQTLAMKALVTDGEVLILRRAMPASPSRPLPITLEVLEAAFLATIKDTVFADGRRIVGGIEFDTTGRRVGYHLYLEHPGSLRPTKALDTRFVPAEDVIHAFRPDRPGQVRGVSWLAPVAQKLADIEDFQQATIMRARVSACLSVFRFMPGSEYAQDDEDPHGLDHLAPGRIVTLAPGEDIRVADPPPPPDADPFIRSLLREIAGALGLTAEALTLDLSKTSFSAARLGRIEAARTISAIQWNLFIPMILDRIAAWLLQDFWLTRMQKPNDLRIQFVPSPIPLIDFREEIGGYADAVKAGFMSRSHAIRTLGYDPERVIEEQEADAREADQRGLVFDSDPRHSKAPALPKPTRTQAEQQAPPAPPEEAA